jgi:IclR family acetate operon transcriptional repressor
MAGRQVDLRARRAQLRASQPGSRVQSLDRALDILEALAASGGEIGLSELSARVGLHVSTVHRLLSVLVARGYARQSIANGRYALGPHVLKLAGSGAGLTPFDLRQEARATLQELAAASGETTNLVVPVDQQIVYVDQVASTRMVRMFTQIGTRAPLYCTGAGKVLLAHRSPPEIEAYLAHEPLSRRTPRTLTTPARLREELARVRAQGYAVDDGELDPEVRCIAAPIFDHTGAGLAAISISGPASRFDEARLQQVLPALLRATAELSSRVGYHPPPPVRAQTAGA